MPKNQFFQTFCFALFLATSLWACSSDEPADKEDSTPAISGIVSVPSQVTAALQETNKTFFARIGEWLFGKSAHALIDGFVGVANVTVSIYEVGIDGVATGAALATATTDADGNYSFTSLPSGVSFDTRYVVRVTIGAETIEARLVNEELNIDPFSTKASNIVTTVTSTDPGGFAAIESSDALVLLEELSALAHQLESSELSSSTVAAIISAIDTAITEFTETQNVINSISATNEICGTVTDASGAVEGIDMVALSYTGWVNYGRSKTAADGTYCIGVDLTDTTEFIVGAMNQTLVSTGASEWYHSSALTPAYTQADAEKVTVVDGTTKTGIDFALEPGGRIRGSVTGYEGVLLDKAIEGVQVFAREYLTNLPHGGTVVKKSGNYVMNIIPGDYNIIARNQTLAAYATAAYDSTQIHGRRSRGFAEKVTVTAGSDQLLIFKLRVGNKVSGEIMTLSTGGVPVAGETVRIDIRPTATTWQYAASERIRTNPRGKYRIWLKAKSDYQISAYGYRRKSLDVSAADAVVNFYGPVGKVDVLVQHNATPVSQAKVFLQGTSNGFIDLAITGSDGTASVYFADDPDTGSVITTPDDFYLYVRIDDPQAHASVIYDGSVTQNLAPSSGTAPTQISLASDGTSNPGSPITINLPNAGVLTGTVSNADGSPAKGTRVQIRSSGTAGTDRFINALTKSDGSYTVSVPAGTYARLRAQQGSSTYSNLVQADVDGVVVTEGQTTTANIQFP
ncbi:MAG: carboxypeptidase-like regulatory domain-containing protein [Gammaproteobacteria bacterium]|nr:carboxypeptidase-like regulatory domain-containing protein [Gammaproteobacteria bacterium]MDH5729454.1 carboxypeptidase-like regulatory domain-containing protein [Gammaproteobacteria bacterium]